MHATRGAAAALGALLWAFPAFAIDLFGGPDEPIWKESAGAASETEIGALEFDEGLVERLTERTGGRAEVLRAPDRSAPIGLAWRVGAAGAGELVAAERRGLAEKGYVIFLAERNFGTEPDRLGVVKAVDPLAPVILQRTAGPTIGVGTREVVSRLREWQEQAPYDLLGAGPDWLEIEFREVPPKLEPLVGQIRELAPDSLGRSPEALEKLGEEIRRSRRVLLWWDE